eukprot:6459591-Amphidinium_carterae.1
MGSIVFSDCARTECKAAAGPRVPIPKQSSQLGATLEVIMESSSSKAQVENPTLPFAHFASFNVLHMFVKK